MCPPAKRPPWFPSAIGFPRTGQTTLGGETVGELTWRARGRLWLRLGLRLALWGLGALFVWKVLPWLLGLFGPFLAALGVAWALNRPTRFLQRKLRLRRGAASVGLVVLAVSAVGGMIAGLGYLLVTQAAAALESWPEMWDGVASGVERVSRSVEELVPMGGRSAAGAGGGTWERLGGWIGDTLGAALSSAAGFAGSFALSLPGFVIGLVIFVMAACAVSADYPRLRREMARWVPGELRGFASRVKRVAACAFGGCVRAEFLLSSMVFAVMLVGFLLMGEPYAVLVAFALAVLDFVPVAGAGTGLAPWAAIEALRGNYAHALALCALWGATALVRQLAEHRVVGGQTGLSPIASLMSIYVGMKLAGVAGMALGPVTWLVLANLARDGVFDNTLRDLRLALSDLAAVLRGA